MGQGLGLLILTLLSSLCLAALFVVLSVFFPRRVEITQQIAESMPARSFLLGLVNFLFFGALVVVFIALNENLGTELFQYPALVIMVALSAAQTFGLAGVVQLVGARLTPEGSPLRRTIWGAAALILACLTPFVGWFGMLPYAGLLGLGAFIIGYFHREGASTAEAGAEPNEEAEK